jgi:hypothetical protein
VASRRSLPGNDPYHDDHLHVIDASKDEVPKPNPPAVDGKQPAANDLERKKLGGKKSAEKKPTKNKGTMAAGKDVTFSYVYDRLLGTIKWLTLSRAPLTFVTIVVGPDSEQTTFQIPKELLCFYSPVFRTAFASGFSEGLTQTMKIEDVETEVFGLLVHWLYRKEIEDGNTVGVLDLIKLWLLAERYIMPELQNATMEFFIPAMKAWGQSENRKKSLGPGKLSTSGGVIEMVYESELETPLRKLLTTQLALSFEAPVLCGMAPTLPPSVLFDILTVLKTKLDLIQQAWSRTDFGLSVGKPSEYFVKIPPRDKTIQR